MAAGKGKRLKSKLPKVLHPVCGRPTLWHVLQAVKAARPERVIVVVAHGSDQVQEAVTGWGLDLPIRFVDQGDPLGTGHAVMVTEGAVGRSEDVLVVSGDEPLVTGDQLRDLVTSHRRRKASATVQTTLAPNVRGLGHVVRDGDAFEKIVEAPKAADHAAAIPEVATGMYVFRREDLFKALPLVGRENKQSEYYLPDVISILKDKGEKVGVLAAAGALADCARTLADPGAWVRALVSTQDRGERVGNIAMFITEPPALWRPQPCSPKHDDTPARTPQSYLRKCRSPAPFDGLHWRSLDAFHRSHTAIPNEHAVV
jgi:NDP-sugar pyrophosphorylase family protein